MRRFKLPAQAQRCLIVYQGQNPLCCPLTEILLGAINMYSFKQTVLAHMNAGLIFLALSILPILGCAQAEHYKIGMANWEFNPVNLTIKPGDTVTWLNDDDTTHDLAFEIVFNSAPTSEKPQKVRETKEFSLVFKKAGTYHYVCKKHEEYDMKGTIIVEK